MHREASAASLYFALICWRAAARNAGAVPMRPAPLLYGIIEGSSIKSKNITAKCAPRFPFARQARRRIALFPGNALSCSRNRPRRRAAHPRAMSTSYLLKEMRKSASRQRQKSYASHRHRILKRCAPRRKYVAKRNVGGHSGAGVRNK